MLVEFIFLDLKALEIRCFDRSLKTLEVYFQVILLSWMLGGNKAASTFISNIRTVLNTLSILRSFKFYKA